MYNSPYRGVLNCIQNVYQKEGISAFYRSYTTQLTMNVPFQTIHFICYEFAQTITNPQGIYDPIAHVGSGKLFYIICNAICLQIFSDIFEENMKA